MMLGTLILVYRVYTCMTKNTLKINKIYLSGYMYRSAGADNLFQTFE